jgi:hypothetical protein
MFDGGVDVLQQIRFQTLTALLEARDFGVLRAERLGQIAF